jgi:hypothetical protein
MVCVLKDALHFFNKVFHYLQKREKKKKKKKTMGT